MTLTSFYPVILTRNVTTTADYFRTWFNFETTFSSDWYVSLVRDSNVELAILDHSHETIPDGHRAPSQGMLLNFEVDDVDQEYERLVTRGAHTPLLDIRTEDFGQRHFILRGPEGILIDVITNTPPSGEYAAQYS
ncbi:VOC family protein [Arthrobacter tecti]